MLTQESMRALALSFEETEESPHFEKTSFRVKNKIFATLDLQKSIACLKLSEEDQSVFSVGDEPAIYPVPNKWGKQGWTNVDLNRVHPDLFADALTQAYCQVAPKKLAEKYQHK